jgi:hypothetical protein
MPMLAHADPRRPISNLFKTRTLDLS